MSGQVFELEPLALPHSAKTRTQGTCLQADSLVWSLRALKTAQETFSDIDNEDEDEESRSRSKTKRLVNEFRAQIRPFCNGMAPPRVGALIDQLPQIEEYLTTINLPLCSSDKTIAVISEKCGLEPVEKELLRFKTSWAFNRLVPLVFDAHFKDVNVRSALEVISVVLRRDINKIRKALSPAGFLSRSRLLTLDCDFEYIPGMSVGDYLSMRSGLLQMFELANGDYQRLVRTMALPIPEEGLCARDFSYLKAEWLLAIEYLKGSLKGGHEGANILLHGLPGVGKTEFARALIRAAVVQGYEIKSTSFNHQILGPHDRRDNFSLACELLPRNRKTVLVFDDADESLVSNSFLARNPFISKAAVNRMLETNVIPTTLSGF